MGYINKKINKSDKPVTGWTLALFTIYIVGSIARWDQINDWTLNIVTGEIAVSVILGHIIMNRLGLGIKNTIIRAQDALIDIQRQMLDPIIEAYEAHPTQEVTNG